MQSRRTSNPTPTHYDTLELAEHASAEAIRGAYKFLAQRWHPDRNPGNMSAAQRTKQLNIAFSVLSDPVQKAIYDAKLAAARQTFLDQNVERSEEGDREEAVNRAARKDNQKRQATEQTNWEEAESAKRANDKRAREDTGEPSRSAPPRDNEARSQPGAPNGPNSAYRIDRAQSERGQVARERYESAAQSLPKPGFLTGCVALLSGLGLALVAAIEYSALGASWYFIKLACFGGALLGLSFYYLILFRPVGEQLWGEHRLFKVGRGFTAYCLVSAYAFADMRSPFLVAGHLLGAAFFGIASAKSYHALLARRRNH